MLMSAGNLTSRKKQPFITYQLTMESPFSVGHFTLLSKLSGVCYTTFEAGKV